MFNPAEGFVVTANQAVVGEQYRHLLTRDWSYGYRSQRIVDMIRDRTTAGKISPEDIRLMQFDNHNGFAPTLVPAAAGGVHRGRAASPRARDLLQRLGLPAAGRPSGPRLGRGRVLQRDLAAPAAADLRRDAGGPHGPTAATGGSRWCGRCWPRPHRRGGTTAARPTVETRDDILRAAMTDAVGRAAARASATTRPSWRWGDLHTLLLRNATFGKSGIAPIEWLFNRGPAGTSGGDAIVNATGWNARDGYEVDAVPRCG